MFNPHLRFKLYLRAKRIRRRGDPELAHLASLVGAGRRTIDVGANRGVYSYWLARCSRVVKAFEPNPDLAQRLAAAGLRPVTVHSVALSDGVGAAELLVPHHHSGGLDDPGGRLDALAPRVSAARFATTRARLDDFGFDEVDFIKIDVEGHEEKVLDGAWDTITANRPALLIKLEERHSRGCLERVVGRFQGLGYQTLFLDDGAWYGLDALGPGQIGPSGRTIINFTFLTRQRASAFTGDSLF
jgi:FkbM family methyltransferase